MSETFTKIGGYIASGDALVYSDSATMTGDGTVQNPFGVKASQLYVQEPLYYGQSGTSGYIGSDFNQTVLWSGFTKMEDNATVVVSEPLTNFEKVEFYMEGYGDGLRVPQVLTFSGSSREYDLAPVGFMGTSIRLNHQRLNFNGVTGTFTETIQIFVAPNGSVTSSTDRPYIDKIVGINRKRV